MLLLLVLIKSRHPSLIFWLPPFITGLLQSDTADESAHKERERERSLTLFMSSKTGEWSYFYHRLKKFIFIFRLFQQPLLEMKVIRTKGFPPSISTTTQTFSFFNFFPGMISFSTGCGPLAGVLFNSLRLVRPPSSGTPLLLAMPLRGPNSESETRIFAPAPYDNTLWPYLAMAGSTCAKPGRANPQAELCLNNTLRTPLQNSNTIP